VVTLDDFTNAADGIAGTTSKREKVRVLANFLRGCDTEELPLATRYFSGSVFATGDPRTLNVGGAVFSRVLRDLGGAGDAEMARAWRQYADVGDVTRAVLAGKDDVPAGAVTLVRLGGLLCAIADASGVRSKTAALRDLLAATTPEGARYVAKLISGDMRIGLREGLVEEAVGVAFGAEPAAVSRAVMLVGDVGEVARLAVHGTLADARPQWFVPLRFMLATPVADAEEAIARMGEDVWVEDKYDGIRCQLHRRGERVALYSRDLKDVTRQFPEVATAAVDVPADVIVDGEVLAFHGGMVMPFQALQTRLGRVDPGADVMRAVPVIYVAWDLLVEGDDVLLDAPLHQRRQRLERLGPQERIALAHLESVRGAAEVNRRFQDARGRRNEGLMLKQPDSPYTPGRRGLNWLKLKQPLDTLDVVVVGAEWGHGKRRGVLSDVTFAVRVDATDDLVTIGKAYSGLTDAETAEMTKLLLESTIADHGHYRTVRPEIVLEVAFDAVQPSTRHKSGYALRFPRIARWRHDKPVSEIDTLSRVRQLAALGTIEREQRVDQAADQ